MGGLSRISANISCPITFDRAYCNEIKVEEKTIKTCDRR